ncbi:acyl-CoA dehydrogenase family protein [Paenibacillus kyungheensis]|uniref:Acyl-CoA dehydrogenase family protein n=1 Tax=Paenibacillus kyungheensis TaxID=1452732 RepID=A0AAX3M889_9BACL|nr:acyl-CoA dehydrogenase family protein [Paenibacillus kyungheensis]WCT58038.1 acyl-CoA dehydrogenase family protein [Paenibacillus kyungheensis]
MRFGLSKKQEQFQEECRLFVDREVMPLANQMDRQENTSEELIARVAEQGYLGAVVPSIYGGSELDYMSLGLMHEQIGRGCSSIRSLLTVHGMVTLAIRKWGTEQQKQQWLPDLATGSLIGAFGLSEPNAGADAKSIETTAELVDGRYILNGRKKWITYGQIADLFLIFACYEGQPTAFLVERSSKGCTTHAIEGILGTRASMLAELHMEHCEVPMENKLGGIGLGLSFVATHCLDYGRFSIAFGAVGIGQGCLNDSLEYTLKRKQFGVALREHQLIQKMITEMTVHIEAARLLCMQLADLADSGDPDSIIAGWKAKYFATSILGKITSDTVQIQGAYGCSIDSNAQRYFRDAKIMEIIEGTTQMHEMIIAANAYTSNEYEVK